MGRITQMPPIPAAAAAAESETHTETCKELRAKYSRHAKSYVPTGVDAETRLFNRLKRDKHAEWIEYCQCNCKGAGKSLLNLFSRLLFDWDYCHLLLSLLVLLEALLGVLIILKRPYTKIDWDAYMDEVAGPLSHGVYDYQLLRGETGPLVYPGGFVWLFGALRWLAGGDGSDVRVAQWVFLGVYMGTLVIILALYAISRPKYMSPWASVLLVVSKRAHSIYMLRLFNDCWAMFFLYAAILLYVVAIKYKKEFCWTIGCVLYSLAVSIKMNIFLTAPALLLLLLL